jgi:hypothetical protein
MGTLGDSQKTKRSVHRRICAVRPVQHSTHRIRKHTARTRPYHSPLSPGPPATTPNEIGNTASPVSSAVAEAEAPNDMSQEELDKEMKKIHDEIDKLRLEHDAVFKKGDKDSNGMLSPGRNA